MKDELLIAAKVRNACEKFNAKVELFDSSLACMCAMASNYLFNKLIEHGYKPVFIEATGSSMESHCWVRVGKTHIDVTATQYGRGIAPVYFFNGSMRDHPTLKKVHRYIEFPSEFTFDTVMTKAGVRVLMKSWPKEQILTHAIEKQLDSFF